MNVRTTAAVLVALLAALPLAYAQRTASPALDATPAATASTASTRAPRTAVDVRHCLAFETNLQVIACAEKYRPDRARAG